MGSNVKSLLFVSSKSSILSIFFGRKILSVKNKQFISSELISLFVPFCLAKIKHSFL